MSKTLLQDGWTHDPDYRRCYQTEDDIKTVLGLLVLGKASGLLDVGCGNGALRSRPPGSIPLARFMRSMHWIRP